MHFDPADGNTSTRSTVKTGTLATPLLQNPVREGFLFDGWTYDGQPFDFQTPILQDTSLKAKWTKTQDWTLSPDHGPASGAVLTISSPSSQEPYYTSIHSAGKQVVGLTGDGRIYTWTQDSTPIQVPSPAQAPEEFHYLQATAGDQWQAALGSDQHIYTWISQRLVPTILDTGQNARFTSISMNDNLLLAVDRQGRVHVFQASLTGSQNLNPKPAEQATISLPAQAQAVTAVASASRILIVDTEGQAWRWDTSNTGKAKPTSIKQNPGMRIIQAQTLNQGFLLLDADRQANYLTNSTNSLTAVSLPDGVQTSRITANKDQAIITSTDGHVWAWKPGEAPKRTDNGNQQYMQTVESSSRIIAINRQGSMFAWSLDGQGRPGKPARLDITQAPTLESASMDGQPLKLSKTGEAWQADIPARKPGTAAITITGRQDGRPFTRNLNYTVEQTLTRDDQQGTTHTVTFNAAGGKPEPTHQTVSTPNGRVKRPSPDPTREGFLFDGWFIEQVAYDFSKPVTKDLTLTAKWSPAGRNSTWSISPDKGSQLGRESTTITPPDSASRGIKFSQVSSSINNGATSNGFSLAVGSDGNAYAWGTNDYGQLGDGTITQRTTPVMVRKPADTPADFTYVQVSAGWQHSLAVGSDGYVYAWGCNWHGQLGNNSIPIGVYNSKAKSIIPVRVRDPAKPTDASKGLKAAQVSAGWGHSLAVGSDGYAYAWGNNWYGQLGNNSTSNSLVPVRVRDPDNPKDESRGLQAIQVSSGYGHSLAVGSDGYAYAWGYNYWGQLGNNNTSSSPSFPVHVRDPDKPTDTSKGLRAMQVSAEYANSLAVGSDGYAYAWGNNYRGQLGNNNNINSNSANPIPLRVRNPTSPTDKSQGLQTIQVSSGHDYSLAVGSDGYAYAWGKNSSSVPVRVRDPAKPTDSSKGLQATQVSAGWSHSLALGSDGNAYAWGDNGAGQLGDGTKTDKSAPVLVSFNLALVITGVRFDQTAVSGLTRGDGNSVTVTTPAHQPGTVTVSVDYTLGGAPQTPDTSLKYTYLPAGVLPQAGGEGILLALATGMTGMGGVLASRRHRREQHRLSHASLE